MHEQIATAAEMFRRVGQLEKVLDLYVRVRNWQEAFIIAERHTDLRKNVYLPYAQWLAENDQFTEAQKGESFFCAH